MTAAAAQTDHPARTSGPAQPAPHEAAVGEQRAGSASAASSAAGAPGAPCPPAAAPVAVSWRFPALPVHVRMARVWLEAWIADRGPGEEAAYRAAVAFSELVTNAVLHGCGPVTVTAVVEPHRIECEISDGACNLPVVWEAEADDEHHRGLSLVDALTTDWHVRLRPEGGKSVTFTVED